MPPGNDRDQIIFRAVFGAAFLTAAIGAFLLAEAVERGEGGRGLAGGGLILAALLGYLFYWRIAWGGRED